MIHRQRMVINVESGNLVWRMGGELFQRPAWGCCDESESKRGRRATKERGWHLLTKRLLAEKRDPSPFGRRKRPRPPAQHHAPTVDFAAHARGHLHRPLPSGHILNLRNAEFAARFRSNFGTEFVIHRPCLCPIFKTIRVRKATNPYIRKKRPIRK